MAIDLTGGYPSSCEYHFPECPSPGMRDASNMWVSDARGRFGVARAAVECVAPGMPGASEHYDGLQHEWEMPDVKMNLVFPDGRVYRFRDVGKKHPTKDDDGRDSILGAGGLAFRCVEPFDVWTASYHGSVVETTSAAMMAGSYDGPTVDIDLDFEATMVTPPWTQGALLTEGSDATAFDAATEIIAPREFSAEHGFRYEQLFRATGSVRVRGDELTFDGSGLRVRRQAVRKLGDFRGMVWQSAVFPSGKAFGCMVFPPREDGVPSFNEGYLFTGDGELIPARVVDAPWLRRLAPVGDSTTLVFESKLGTTTIEGETTGMSSYEVGNTKGMRPHMPEFPVLYQGIARYRWDGEETYGVSERSSQRDLIEWS